LASGFGYEVDPIRCFALQWVVYTMTMFIPTPGASGGAEASFLLAFSSILPPEIAGFIMTAWRFVTFHILVALAAVVFASLETPRVLIARRIVGLIGRLRASARPDHRAPWASLGNSSASSTGRLEP
jgi:hypothetical protein